MPELVFGDEAVPLIAGPAFSLQPIGEQDRIDHGIFKMSAGDEDVPPLQIDWVWHRLVCRRGE